MTNLLAMKSSFGFLRQVLFVIAAAIGITARGFSAVMPCEIEVVDAENGWPVPLVELRTTHEVSFVTDNAGIVAFDLPECMGKETWFDVRGQGYEVKKDGYGSTGVRLKTEPGGHQRIEVTRTIIAKRLGRLTGAGLFGESQKLGRENTWQESGIVGCDSVQNTIYCGRLFWLWGDTVVPNYRLGIFDGTSATTSTKPISRFEPPLRLNLEYFKNAEGVPRGIAKMPGAGPTWVSGYVSLPDASGQEHLVSTYAKVRNWLDIYQWGMATWNDKSESFEQQRLLWEQSSKNPHPPLILDGHAVKWMDAAGRKWVLFCDPFPTSRCPATFEAWQNTNTWESLKAQKTLRAAGTKEVVKVHSGGIAWNPWRKRWVTVFVQGEGKSSVLGEIWYAEADAPTGPWGAAVKILSHDNYTFYNPSLHPEFVSDDSPVLIFEGTYTAEFAKHPQVTPRYNYNQMLYRLDLDDPRLLPAHEK
jgi:hypothetical protein